MRRRRLEGLDVDGEAAEAAIARLLALAEAERRARLAAPVRLEPARLGRRAWDPAEAFAWGPVGRARLTGHDG